MPGSAGADELGDVQPRIPRQSISEQSVRHADGAAVLSAELAAVVAGARRRAQRDGDRQIDTAHLLHSLLESDPEARAVFDEGPQMARLLGYLVQRSIGYGLRWQGAVEASDALPTPPALSPVTESATEGFSPLAAGAMGHACERAALRGGEPARCVDLLAAIVLDPQARAVEVLARAGVDPREVAARIDSGLGEYAGGAETAW